MQGTQGYDYTNKAIVECKSGVPHACEQPSSMLQLYDMYNAAASYASDKDYSYFAGQSYTATKNGDVYTASPLYKIELK